MRAHCPCGSSDLRSPDAQNGLYFVVGLIAKTSGGRMSRKKGFVVRTSHDDRRGAADLNRHQRVTVRPGQRRVGCRLGNIRRSNRTSTAGNNSVAGRSVRHRLTAVTLNVSWEAGSEACPLVAPQPGAESAKQQRLPEQCQNEEHPRHSNGSIPRLPRFIPARWLERHGPKYGGSPL